MSKNVKMWSKNSEKRGGLISALKPGPVVPPGIEKTPDQAARISQSVDFGHLSDILAILRGGHFFDIFCHFFTFLILMIFHFSVFLILSLLMIFDFCHFYCFYILMILINFCHFFMFGMIFDQFLCLN